MHLLHTCKQQGYKLSLWTALACCSETRVKLVKTTTTAAVKLKVFQPFAIILDFTCLFLVALELVGDCLCLVPPLVVLLLGKIQLVGRLADRKNKHY